MRALLKNPNGELLVAQVPEPSPRKGQVLIKVEAASFSRADWGGRRPPRKVSGDGEVARGASVLGSDVAGVVTRSFPGCPFEVGDRVCAVASGLAGAAAEYAVADAAWCALIPAGMSAERAAALPSSATTALAALDKAGDVAGRRVLVCGASGGVGQYAVLLFSQAGARVTAACGRTGLRAASGLGAERTFDYADGLKPAAGQNFDVVVAVNGKFAVREHLGAMRPGGKLVVVGTDALTPRLLRVPVAGRKLSLALFFACIKRDGLRRAVELVAQTDAEPATEVLDGFEAAAERLVTVPDEHPHGKMVVRL